MYPIITSIGFAIQQMCFNLDLLVNIPRKKGTKIPKGKNKKTKKETYVCRKCAHANVPKYIWIKCAFSHYSTLATNATFFLCLAENTRLFLRKTQVQYNLR